MVWRDILREATKEAQGALGRLVQDRLDHPLRWALAHGKAATYYRKAAEDARLVGKRRRARWLGFLAMFHRMRRRRFEHLALASAEAAQCLASLQKLEDA